jgi:hypothetical protein
MVITATVIVIFPMSTHHRGQLGRGQGSEGRLTQILQGLEVSRSGHRRANGEGERRHDTCHDTCELMHQCTPPFSLNDLGVY